MNDSSIIESCIADKEISDRYSEPMHLVGLYIFAASAFCFGLMLLDLIDGFQHKKFWFPSKYFSLNATSISVIPITLKLSVDLTGVMPTYVDQAAKVATLGFMCTMMVNLMPSLASMDNNTLLVNMVGLSILVITVIVNICIQIYTGVIANTIFPGDRYMNFPIAFTLVASTYTALMLLLLLIMISLSLAIPTCKEILESKYQAIVNNNTSLADQDMSRVEKLRQHVTRYWVMAETGSPQFAMASNPLSIASGVSCLLVSITNLVMLLKYLIIISNSSYYHQVDISNGFRDDNFSPSPYKGATGVIFLTQCIGTILGSIAPLCRCLSVFSFKDYFMVLKVEEYWTQKLHEWKEIPLLGKKNRNRFQRSYIYNSKYIVLSVCIGYQKMIVILCKVVWIIVTAVPVFVVRYLTPLLTSTTNDIDEDISNYVLQVDDRELNEKTLKRISNSMNSLLKAEKEQPNNLLELLEKSTGFQGVDIFDTNHVQPLIPVELVNSWSLPIVTLTCVAVALPDIRERTVKSLLTSVDEGLSFTRPVEESLNSASEYVNIQKASLILWHEIENKCMWLDNPLAKNVLKGKTTTEIINWFSDTSKEIITKISQSTNGGPVGKPPKALIAANSMYRITQTILLRYPSDTEEPITNEQLFSHINEMIADIFCACFTNIPQVIKMRCDEKVIEKREESVKVAAELLGKTTKIIERLETRDVPSMDDEKMAYIDEWRLYFKHSIP